MHALGVACAGASIAWPGAPAHAFCGFFVAGSDGPDGVELKGRPNDLIALVTFATHPETAKRYAGWRLAVSQSPGRDHWRRSAWPPRGAGLDSGHEAMGPPRGADRVGMGRGL